MAKAGKSNLIEQHAEKGLLVLAVAVLVFVVFKYVTSSPREFKTPWSGGRRALSPEQIDEHLRKEALQVRRDMVKVRADKNPVVDPTKEIKRRQREAFGGTEDAYQTLWDKEFIALASPVQMPEIMPPVSGEGVKLKPIDIRPSPPLVGVKREVPLRKDPSDMAAHAVSTFPWGQLKDKWDKAFEGTPTRPPMVVLRAWVEVRERTIGGNWGPAKAAPVSTPPIQATIAGEDRVLRLPYDLPKVPQYEPDGSNLPEVEATISFLVSLQEPILQPQWYPIWWAGSREYVNWKIHLPMTEVSRKYAEGGGAGALEGPLRRGRPVRPRRAPPVRRRMPAPRRLPPGRTEEEEYERARRAREAAARRAAARKAAAREAGPRPTPPRRRLEEEERARRIGPGARPGVRPRPKPGRPEEEPFEVVPPPDPMPVPPLQQQLQEGNVLVWFHQDTDLDFRKEYQFRVQLEFLNPLYMEEKLAKDLADARVISLRTPFSEWSAPVSVPQATRFYLVGAMPQDKYARVAVFAFCYGELVQKRFNVYEGQPIGGKAVVKVPNPALRATGQMGGQPRGLSEDEREVPRTVKKEVDFSTGAIGVQFDFAKPYERPGLTPGRTVEMLHVDFRGRLLRRLLAKDRSDKRYRQLLAEVRRAEAAAKPVERKRR